MKTRLSRMLFSRAFVKTTMCAVFSVGAIPMLSYAEAGEVQVANIVQQERTIKGTIVDANGIPIIGANVMEKGTTNGTITDLGYSGY